ncbi:MAG: GNAT family N-acetyltransferase [Lachnospiraceae bacterium]|nr:GNAT family N-acetyltransferase [Lachnospiraceae bacterium]
MKKLFSEIPYIQSGTVILKAVTEEDADSLREMVNDPDVYRYLPTFLFEQKYGDIGHVIRHLYDECLKESLILGIHTEEDGFCGLAEMYGLRDEIHKISVGYRLLKRCWGKGIASRTLRLMTGYLLDETDIEIITASTMVDNRASARVLEKNGFSLVVHDVPEDWGYPEPTAADKWIR